MGGEWFSRIDEEWYLMIAKYRFYIMLTSRKVGCDNGDVTEAEVVVFYKF